LITTEEIVRCKAAGNGCCDIIIGLLRRSNNPIQRTNTRLA